MPKNAYKYYLLSVLTLLVLFNYVDRMALGVMLEDIKADLHLSDTQLGFLSGIAFALFYSVMGVPMGRWADRGNRVAIISVTTALWSITVALCGAVTNFGQLLLIRVGVAVGEAGCIPPAHSLMADYFTRHERPRAAAIYATGAALSFVVGFFGGGWLNEMYGWRATFMILGIPGFLLAAVAALTLREPRSVAAVQATQDCNSPPGLTTANEHTLAHVCITLWRNATFRSLLLCLSMLHLFGYGILQWQPAFFIRSYGFTTGQIGTWLAVAYGIGGLIGTYVGGEWASRRAANNERLQLQVMAVAVGVAGVLAAFVYLTFNAYIGLGLVALYVFGIFTINGPLYATIQTLVPERIRATSVALMYLAANLIGMGLGPLAAGAASDALGARLGDESLRYALLLLTPGYFVGAWYAWHASGTVERDLAAQLGGAEFADGPTNDSRAVDARSDWQVKSHARSR
jgi:MFS family permease